MGNTMKKVRKVEPFNWSRTPTQEGVERVFLADPNAYTTFGKSITKDELCNSLAVHNRIIGLENKKQMLRDTLFFVLAMIPVFFFIYNIFIGVNR
jgi:hypothetical protein